MDCFRAVKTDAGSASFPKAKEYQKMKIGARDCEEDQHDWYTEESSSEELRDTAPKESKVESASGSLEGCSEACANWWELDWFSIIHSFARIFSSEDDRKIKTAGQ